MFVFDPLTNLMLLAIFMVCSFMCGFSLSCGLAELRRQRDAPRMRAGVHLWTTTRYGLNETDPNHLAYEDEDSWTREMPIMKQRASKRPQRRAN